jgi:hypothetical protein
MRAHDTLAGDTYYIRKAPGPVGHLNHDFVAMLGIKKPVPLRHHLEEIREAFNATYAAYFGSVFVEYRSQIPRGLRTEPTSR